MADLGEFTRFYRVLCCTTCAHVYGYDTETRTGPWHSEDYLYNPGDPADKGKYGAFATYVSLSDALTLTHTLCPYCGTTPLKVEVRSMAWFATWHPLKPWTWGDGYWSPTLHPETRDAARGRLAEAGGPEGTQVAPDVLPSDLGGTDAERAEARDAEGSVGTCREARSEAGGEPADQDGARRQPR